MAKGEKQTCREKIITRPTHEQVPKLQSTNASKKNAHRKYERKRTRMGVCREDTVLKQEWEIVGNALGLDDVRRCKEGVGGVHRDEKAPRLPRESRLVVCRGNGGDRELLLHCPKRRAFLGVLGSKLEQRGMRTGVCGGGRAWLEAETAGTGMDADVV